jgi:hypothetical protein
MNHLVLLFLGVALAVMFVVGLAARNSGMRPVVRASPRGIRRETEADRSGSFVRRIEELKP